MSAIIAYSAGVYESFRVVQGSNPGQGKQIIKITYFFGSHLLKNLHSSKFLYVRNSDPRSNSSVYKTFQKFQKLKILKIKNFRKIILRKIK